MAVSLIPLLAAPLPHSSIVYTCLYAYRNCAHGIIYSIAQVKQLASTAERARVCL